jgi:methyl-accepting chemotaxis protein
MIFNKKKKRIRYLEEEILRLENNLKKLSNGDFNLQYGAKQSDDIFSEERPEFQEIDRYLNGITDNYNELLKDTEALKRSLQSGETNYRMKTAGNNGVVRKIAENVNSSLEAVFAPFDEIKDILELVEKNDLTKSVEGSYKGRFGDLTNTLNMVILRLRSVQNAFIKLAEGDTGLLEEFESIGQRSHNDKIMPAAIQAYRHIRSLVTDINKITLECMEGNIKGARGNPEEYPGGYKEIILGVNNIMDSLSKPIYQALEVLSEMVVNDYTRTMSTDVKGDFLVLANEINNVQKRLLAAQNVAQKISKGDISELDNFRKIGRRSENDHLVPSFIAMMEAIQDLINETGMLSKAAGEGDLSVRGNAGKFQGGYADIIRGINHTLDGVVTPIRETIDVLTKMSQGYVDCLVQGDYKGDYANLKNALNSTLKTLKMVITDVGHVLKNISEGNLNINFTNDYHEDYQVISDSLKEIIKSLNYTLSEVNAAAEQVASGAGQISQASLTLSQGAEEQAGSIEEVTSSLTEVSSQVKQNAVNANEANKLSLIAKNNAVKGNEHMKEMQQAMYDINTSSSNISKIIKVIDDIAFQTNILALNAAVEAARAGQYGKGFAVVAEEVRNLAQKSAGAAKDTTTMIEGSIEKVEAGTKIANNTAAALNEIVESITKTAELVDSIATASTEQAAAISQINQAVDQVSGVIQTNSATAEESASSSEELSSQADLLKQMVGRFKLKKMQMAGDFGMEGASPEVLKAIQEMLKNKGAYTEDRSTGDSQAPPRNKISISLDDKEFGKY